MKTGPPVVDFDLFQNTAQLHIGNLIAGSCT